MTQLSLLKMYLCENGFPALATRPTHLLMTELTKARGDVILAGQALMERSRRRPDLYPRDDGDLQAQSMDEKDTGEGIGDKDSPPPLAQ